jgi:hypothetical protein
MLHQLGLDYSRLAYQRHGRDERLTDVAHVAAEADWVIRRG